MCIVHVLKSWRIAIYLSSNIYIYNYIYCKLVNVCVSSEPTGTPGYGVSIVCLFVFELIICFYAYYHRQQIIYLFVCALCIVHFCMFIVYCLFVCMYVHCLFVCMCIVCLFVYCFNFIFFHVYCLFMCVLICLYVNNS